MNINQMSREQFEAHILRFFGLNEALRSDASYEELRAELGIALTAWPARPGRPETQLYVAWTFADRLVAYGGD